MCQAKKWFEKLGSEPYYMYSCGGLPHRIKSGFIFRDGSILDIDGEDHSIISKEDRYSQKIATYWFNKGEADICVAGDLNRRQADVFLTLCKLLRARKIYIDVYKGAKYMGTIELNNVPNATKLIHLVDSLSE